MPLAAAGIRGGNCVDSGAGHAVAGWWADGGAGTPVVLLVHGIRADRSSMVSRAQLLMRRGFSVLLIDLQGHGETPGKAITLGYWESADVVAARDWIRSTVPDRQDVMSTASARTWLERDQGLYRKRGEGTSSGSGARTV